MEEVGAPGPTRRLLKPEEELSPETNSPWFQPYRPPEAKRRPPPSGGLFFSNFRADSHSHIGRTSVDLLLQDKKNYYTLIFRSKKEVIQIEPIRRGRPPTPIQTTKNGRWYRYFTYTKRSSSQTVECTPTHLAVSFLPKLKTPSFPAKKLKHPRRIRYSHQRAGVLYFYILPLRTYTNNTRSRIICVCAHRALLQKLFKNFSKYLRIG